MVLVVYYPWKSWEDSHSNNFLCSGFWYISITWECVRNAESQGASRPRSESVFPQYLLMVSTHIRIAKSLLQSNVSEHWLHFRSPKEFKKNTDAHAPSSEVLLQLVWSRAWHGYFSKAHQVILKWDQGEKPLDLGNESPSNMETCPAFETEAKWWLISKMGRMMLSDALVQWCGGKINYTKPINCFEFHKEKLNL